MLALGVFGWLLKETGFPRAPLLIGFVLAVPMERYYFLTANIYAGLSWMLRPWVIVFLTILMLPAIVSGIRRGRARLRRTAEEPHAGPPPEDEHEGKLAGSVWSRGLSAAMLLVFVAGLLVAGSFSPEARLVPRLVCAGGAIVAALLVFTEFRTWRRAAKPGVTWTRDVGVALKTFMWMVAFLGLITLFGYVAALLLFVPAFLLYVARAKPRTVIVYGLSLAIVIAALPSLVPIDLPRGLIT